MSCSRWLFGGWGLASSLIDTMEDSLLVKVKQLVVYTKRWAVIIIFVIHNYNYRPPTHWSLFTLRMAPGVLWSIMASFSLFLVYWYRYIMSWTFNVAGSMLFNNMHAIWVNYDKVVATLKGPFFSAVRCLVHAQFCCFIIHFWVVRNYISGYRFCSHVVYIRAVLLVSLYCECHA